MSNIIDFSERLKTNTTNVTDAIITSSSNDYMNTLRLYNVDFQNINTASDVALIQFLMKGAAHRSQGESHPSQRLLDSIHKMAL